MLKNLLFYAAIQVEVVTPWKVQILQLVGAIILLIISNYVRRR